MNFLNNNINTEKTIIVLAVLLCLILEAFFLWGVVMYSRVSAINTRIKINRENQTYIEKVIEIVKQQKKVK